MDDLVVWLRAQVAYSRQLVVDCTEEIGAHLAGEPFEGEAELAERDAYPSYPWGRGIGELSFMADTQPRVVLAQCDAHTALLEAYENAEARRAQLTEAFTRNLKEIAALEPAEERRRYSAVSTANGVVTGYGMAVLLAALSYRHRPGYREEWRP